ncbi:sulfate transporter family-domain-containing protein [Chytriomyces sp. MP71]|nr:sulfate transporter family-domain-containing protein [Chytriomyces sp. MP71]
MEPLSSSSSSTGRPPRIAVVRDRERVRGTDGGSSLLSVSLGNGGYGGLGGQGGQTGPRREREHEWKRVHRLHSPLSSSLASSLLLSRSTGSSRASFSSVAPSNRLSHRSRPQHANSRQHHPFSTSLPVPARIASVRTQSLSISYQRMFLGSSVSPELSGPPSIASPSGNGNSDELYDESSDNSGSIEHIVVPVPPSLATNAARHNLSFHEDDFDDDEVTAHSNGSTSQPLLGHHNANHQTTKDSLDSWPFALIKCLPSVALGLLLILLDSLSYGVIVFPSASSNSVALSPGAHNSVLPDTAPQVGVQIFLVSSLIAQFTYTFTSKFPGANGSMQIEVMPFLYLMVESIQSRMLASSTPSSPESVLATIMVAFALSTVLTGVVFFLLAHFRLGNLVQFFPRQVLIGCIGGIGWFLMVTGVEITSHIDPEMSLEFLAQMFEPARLVLWGSSLSLAVFLKLLQHKIKHPLFVPLFYCIVPIMFYGIASLCGVSLQTLRDHGFLFNMSSETLPYYTLWTYFNGMRGIDWAAVMATLPIQFSLVFFALLHVPINIPALGVSTNTPYDMNNELYSHGISNLVAGLAGTLPNYLVYSNSLLVMRCGGESRLAGGLLTVGAAALWIAGGDVIRYVPVLLVGCLIFHLAMDLLLESIVDTLHMPLTRLEYGTILSIVVVMGVFGFTEGILLGICLALLFFVLEYAAESIILDTFDGRESMVRRSMDEQEFLERARDKVYGVKLYGFLFFGVISQVEKTVMDAIDENLEDGTAHRLEFVIVDFKLVKGVDFSALQGLQRLKEKTDSCGIQLIFCSLGKHRDSVAKSNLFDLPNENLDSDLDLYLLEFDTDQTALEHCENQLLHAMQMKAPHYSPEGRNILIDILRASPLPGPMHMGSNGGSTTATAPTSAKVASVWSEIAHSVFMDVSCVPDEVIWDAGEVADALFVVRTGSLVAQVAEGNGRFRVVQSFLPGSVVGEVPFFAGSKYPTRLVASTEFTGWQMSRADFNRLCQVFPAFAVPFIQQCLKYAN